MKKIIKLCYFFIMYLLCSCSSNRPAGNTEAEVLFKEAQKFIDKGQYILANEKLNNLRSQHPYSFYSTPAELMQADILFKQENYVESAQTYILFKDFHPKHEKVAYVTWQIAESFHKQLPSTYDRDLSQGLEAIKYYQEIIEKYPQCEYVPEAKSKILAVNDMFKSKEKYIADFYFKTKVYDAARYRYLMLIEEFADENLTDFAVSRVLESSLYLKEKEECLNYYNKLKLKASEAVQVNIEKLFQKCNSI